MQGTLDEFSVGDLLQLYQVAGRTGTIRVWRDDALARTIFVDRGRISGAGGDEWNLVDEIRRIEWLTDDVRSQLDVIERDGGETGLSLIARALLTSPAWEYFSERQLERLVYPVLTWTTGAFEATVDVVPRVAPLRINQSPQQLVLSAARWEEEMRAAEQQGFGPDTRWVCVRQPPDTVSVIEGDPVRIVELMDEPRTIEELSAASGISSLRVIDQLRQYTSSGVVKPAT